MQQRILIAGVGNIFLGDDAFGVEVARRLAEREQPNSVRVVDFGIRGIDLAYALLDGYDAMIMVDATSRGEQPGTLYLIEPTLEEASAPEGLAIEPHSLDPVKVLRFVTTLGGHPRRLLVVGCEPAALDSEDGRIGLSEPVQAAADEAVQMIESLVQQILAEDQGGRSR